MGRKSILLIEDDRNLHALLSFRFKKWGFDIIIAADGKEGLEKAKKELPDLIILDLMLPKLPGEEVCRRLKKDEKTKNIPIIMLTAKTSDVDRVVGKVIGADRYLYKPYDPEELLEEVKQLI